MDHLLNFGKLAAASTAIITLIGVLWLALGPYRPALSQDIERLDRAGAEVATEVYTAKRDSLTLLKGQIEQQPPSPLKDQQNQIVDQQLRDAQRKLERAETRSIELGR